MTAKLRIHAAATPPRRRIVVATVLTLTLVVAAACSDSQPETGGGAGLATAAAAPTETPVTDIQPPTTLEPAEPETLTFQSVTLAEGTTISFGVLVPPDFDPTREWPVLLALPPGGQGAELVRAGFDLYWNAAPARGWVVMSPAAPGGTLFFNGSELLIDEFLDIVSQTYQPEGGRFHIAGVSNGGISAFRIATGDPARFNSLIAVPGFPRSEADTASLNGLVDLRIAMFVGERDTGWIAPMRTAFETLDGLGADVTFEIVPGQPHAITSLSGDDLFDILDEAR